MLLHTIYSLEQKSALTTTKLCSLIYFPVRNSAKLTFLKYIQSYSTIKPLPRTTLTSLKMMHREDFLLSRVPYSLRRLFYKIYTLQKSGGMCLYPSYTQTSDSPTDKRKLHYNPGLRRTSTIDMLLRLRYQY